jgi:hypothetical protein
MKALSREDLKRLAPQTFNHKVSAKLTSKYVHIPTDIIVDDMEKLGWFPYEVKSVKARKSNGSMTKHLIQFFNPDIIILDETGKEDMCPQLLLVNSHDGTTAVRFEMGVFRFVCENGLVIKSKDFGGFKMKHMGYNFEDLRVHINTLVQTLPQVVERLNTFTQIQMTVEQQHEFAVKAVTARFGEEKVLPQGTIDELLTPVRFEDKGDTAWLVMNKIQEKLTQGGFGYMNAKGKPRKARGIKNFTQDVEFNQKLWQLLEDTVLI